MKKREFGIKNVIYFILTIGAIIAFLVLFKIDQLARCAFIDYNSAFTQIKENIYVPNTMNKEQQELILEYIDVAKERSEVLFGSVTGNPKIIITLSEETAEVFRGSNVGVTHSSAFGLYIIIGPAGINVDVISHEYAHSELASRVGWYKTNKIPIWFNEGLAIQVDERQDYSLTQWNRITNNGTQILEVKDFDQQQEFYVADVDRRIDNYILAKHEVGTWLEIVGTTGLNRLLESYKKGEDLYYSYIDLLLEYSREKVKK